MAQKLLGFGSLAQLRPAISSRFLNTKCDRVPTRAANSFLFDVLNRFSTTRKLMRRSKTFWITKVIEPAITTEKPECTEFELDMYGVHEYNTKISVEGNTILIEAKGDNKLLAVHGFKNYLCWIELPPDNIYKISDIKADFMINGGALRLTVPKWKQDQRVFDVKINPVDRL